MSAPVVATVGTTHPLAFAGLLFAVSAIAADGARPVAVVAGISAQDGRHVLARAGVDPELIAAQFAALRDAGVAAFHVGALVSAQSVVAVAAGLAHFAGVPVVVDPVLAATGGDALADAAVVEALRAHLIPAATLVTPNLAEANAIAGAPVDGVAAMEAAAAALVALGARAALVKGGHLEGEPVDVLADGSSLRRYASPRLAGSLRGTGDLLAVTIATELARGSALGAAVERARARVRDAIVAGEPFAGTQVARLR
ncbi:MAG TPA: PfkB family carbohydrate kinase [Candidatus Elarobacter sp.]|jgi:hydroxymethylpyrimidine kinase/phosphomethylpyrimidine kinase